MTAAAASAICGKAPQRSEMVTYSQDMRIM